MHNQPITQTFILDYYKRIHTSSDGNSSGVGGYGGGSGADSSSGDTNFYGGPPDKTKHGAQGASGLDFIVPAGFPNDSFPINVQSGEHVSVTPAGGGNGNSELAAQMAKNNAILTRLPYLIRDAVAQGR
jgi:hypothetical protein